MHAVDVAMGVGWLAFWTYWLAAAVGVKTGRTRWGRFAVVRLLIAIVVIILARTHALQGHAPHNAWLAGIGLTLWVLGLSLAIWARLHLGRNWGTPMTEKSEPELVTTGPYRWVRNPIYSGLIFALVGTTLAVSVYWLPVVAIVAGYFVYSAFMEQRFMAASFPDTYPAYRRSTKMLIPFVF